MATETSIPVLASHVGGNWRKASLIVHVPLSGAVVTSLWT